jgi:stearoyl-CoA desaturase (delta-9 desaturase)
MLAIDLVAFGWWGFLVWGIQMIWVPFWAAGVINGLAHWWGYRNYKVDDTSTNLIPWAFWIGGEELHNNHHGDGTSARFSKKWWEFDIGWMYICILQALGLAKLRTKT